MSRRGGIIGLIGALSLLSLFRILYVLHGPLSLAPDEAYFWDWARHPAWCYYDMGPMIAWIIAATTHVFGDTELGVRAGSIILSVGTSCLLYALTLDILEDAGVALMSALLWNVIPIGATGSIIATYYSPQVFLWALSLLILRKAVSSESRLWWGALGGTIGLGLLSHYTFMTLSGQIGLYLLLSPKQRRWLLRPEPYAALALAFLIFSPALVWNAHHEYVIFRHASGQLGNGSTQWRSLADYIGGQIGVISPVAFFGVMAGLWKAARAAVRKGDDRGIFLVSTSVPLLVFIGSLSLAKRTEANWPVSAYVAGFIAFAWWLQDSPALRRRLFFGTAFGTALLLSTIAHFPGLLCRVYDLPPNHDPSNRLYGWRDLGRHLTALREKDPNTFLCSLDYATPAELSFYTEGHPQGYQLPISWRRSQYDYWDVNHEKGRDAIYVKNGSDPIEPAVKDLFDSVELADHVSIHKDCGQGLERKSFSLYLCRSFHGCDTSGANRRF